MQVHLKTIHDTSAATVWAGPRAVTIDRTPRAGGMGIGFSGEELLLMSIGASYCNVLYREATGFNIEILEVEIIVNADWAGEPAQARNVRFDVKIKSNAPREQVEALLKHTDKVSEVNNSLRTGIAVRLNEWELLKEVKP
ncbi:putative OsmC-like protein [Chitinophaga skermanii]|uniref:Putative OsmC-like protein n=1 Tax=Chitinophaga skermanii TaxID=331697 RepID=A0A327QCM6_9BACT|nr:OsmC family protein [Chitinophaga skermanii]RAI99436.1 putative OsmC-like protein [Chitinophaga skermanii]